MAINLTSRVPGLDLTRLPGFSQTDYKRVGAQIPYLTWKSMMLRMTELMGEAMLDDHLGFTLPVNLGMLRVVKMKPRKNAELKPMIDFKHLIQTGKVKRQHNLHSFGAVYRIEWIRLRTTQFANQGLYRFKACRPLNRRLAQLIFSGKDYLPRQRDSYSHRV